MIMTDAEEFFAEGIGGQKCFPSVRGTGHKAHRKGQSAFEDAKIKMVMRIEGCGREEATRLIAERAAARRANEESRRGADECD